MNNPNPPSGNWLQRLWWFIRDLYQELKPCRFSFIVALLACPVFLVVAQGTEVLRTVGEGSALGSQPEPFRLFLFFVALAAWSVTSWYSARVLLYINFPDQRTAPCRPWAERHVPRILGVAPLLIVAAGFFVASGSYDPHSLPFRWLLFFGALCLVLALIFYLFLIWRRKWINASTDRGDAAAHRETKRLSQLDRSSLIGLAIMGGGASGLLVLFTINPVAAQNLGNGAILFLAAATWVTLGGFLVYLSHLWRFPVISFLVLIALVFSFWNDNHFIRRVAAQETKRPDVVAAFNNWYTLIEKDHTGATHPLFIVATEGGGIRAAYWTAVVLGQIQDENPDFARHLFAISGVSGGSLGAAVFEGLLAEPPMKSFKEAGAEILGQDFLSPALAAMLYPDLVQRFLPWPFGFLDRGRALELGWEKAWRDTIHNDRFASSFVDLWNPRPDGRAWMPALLLNGTSVEKGNRIITSNLELTGSFIDAVDAARKLSAPGTSAPKAGCHIPLSTAAHMSARFTFVSPAGRFPDGSHIVDGGYFENSASTAAYELALRIKEWCDYKNIQNVEVKVIMISNDPRKPPIDPKTPGPKSTDPKRTEPEQESGNFLGDVTAPIYALMNTRDARGTYAQQTIRQEQRRYKANMTRPASATKNIVYFRLRDTSVPLPLGWMLSREAAKTMLTQIRQDDDVVQNGSAIDEILQALPPRLP